MDDEWSIFLGFGSCHDLRDADRPWHRFHELKSVSPAAADAYARRAAGQRSQGQPIGFHRPRKP